jgi:hypothetical protein
MGFLVVLPIVAFDVWLACTTGRRQVSAWLAQKNWRNLAATATASVLLAIWLGFFIKYSYVKQLRFQGFPIPVAFFHFNDDTWSRTTPAAPLPALATAANFLTGLVAPFIPFKIAEFFKTVKAELK